MNASNFAHLKRMAMFAAIVEAGSFSAAARRLKTDRSKLSKQLSELEIQLGSRLIHRSTRKLSVTLEGQKVYNEVKQLPYLLAHVESLIAPKEVSGRVSLTMTYDIAINQVLPILETFREEYPDVELDLVMNDHKSDIVAENIDLALRVGSPQDSSLIARQMFEQSAHIFASPDYIEKHGMPLCADDLESHYWILLEQQSASNNLQKLFYEGKPVTVAPKHYHCCNSPLVMQTLTKMGVGIGLLIPCTIQKEIEAGELVQVACGVRSEPKIFNLVYPSRKQMPARIRHLIDFLMGADIFSGMNYTSC
ncbi:Putative Transcriptional regulator, LysR family [Vibrio nigripulchritudo MADA3029]|uniref:LysR family transcriptional regulator n=1 Tax=Vibrio nigripulchritudo TaxID=28173 RepID=UPI00021C10CA|nr:LysR family transcriptional regulator [Vibrio nigripulchritudo]EGU61176.1 LysR family transcriptional regulator [Vibrio nigripulchritudo ATCC 27043]CCN49441.1 Putative Transcriptional regulator, LysR family [Vibrio nigripulchritudo MADA3020]CCN53761.1 Putative Transcriptional regulator, LysR family [Vibrio nigripulchritudo MADA3021]CCN58893.1 Putative Transcriptional regulator, LysR family [Vibrio nigripulchritudo MADA3029]